MNHHENDRKMIKTRREQVVFGKFRFRSQKNTCKIGGSAKQYNKTGEQHHWIAKQHHRIAKQHLDLAKQHLNLAKQHHRSLNQLHRKAHRSRRILVFGYKVSGPLIGNTYFVPFCSAHQFLIRRPKHHLLFSLSLHLRIYSFSRFRNA